MIIVPRPLTDRTLTRGELSDDKRKCLKIGPCGLGDKAIYLNSFYIDRIYYVPYTEVARVFKRVAMSKGGYSGKGMFGSMPYLVVRFKNRKSSATSNMKIRWMHCSMCSGFNIPRLSL